ncbi:hypothetical protein CEXT_294021 [Caerostris extrusa]|uniref:Uncharacterized protein n=1 Tax=Caerostris extrusa TaxID=172846 RepID=A0AAV4M929_CAEEX|nr:hypothetical protein CEXT_294021 [Caerostris extrusa]
MRKRRGKGRRNSDTLQKNNRSKTTKREDSNKSKNSTGNKISLFTNRRKDFPSITVGGRKSSNCRKHRPLTCSGRGLISHRRYLAEIFLFKDLL